MAFGLLLAVAGELSWLNLVFPQILFLVPLVRFPGFIWLIAVGFALPKRFRNHFSGSEAGNWPPVIHARADVRTTQR
ncbi:MAG: hypothetical protein ACR2IV_07475 [Bryobacteraceae bacterium]